MTVLDPIFRFSQQPRRDRRRDVADILAQHMFDNITSLRFGISQLYVPL